MPPSSIFCITIFSVSLRGGKTPWEKTPSCTYESIHVYRVPRSQIGYTLMTLLDDIYVVDEDVVRYASRLFGSSMLDYVDCLLVARNVLHGEHILSFDKPLLKRTLSL